ncbi:MAG: 5-amino-6-(D-ribitylamino)uracil--L-tyrosine 4-hydroxyphenyl transferase CofH [Vulcanimicrobiota bacterium]
MTLANLYERRRQALSAPVGEALEAALAGHDLERDQALVLARVRGVELEALVQVADHLREQQCGHQASYVVNRNVNFTNVCIKRCTFCAFSRDHRLEEAYYLPQHEVLRRIQEAIELGATEVCVQAGLPPKMDGSLYVELTRAIKSHFPTLHLHAFSPEEVLYGAIRSRSSIGEYLQQLKEAGLDSLPGTSAEILDQDLRDKIAPGRITVEQWTEVIEAAHQLGLPTTSTMMFGHLEAPDHWVDHMLYLRELQKRTGGFSEFVPLSFVHQEAPMMTRLEGVRAGATGAEVVLVHALARVLLGAHLRNIQASWVKEGPKLAQILLAAGCNDLGGTLINESISTSAGASFGQLVPPAELRRILRDAGRLPVQRNTLYGVVRRFESEPLRPDALDQVADPEGRFGSFQQLVAAKEHRFVHPLRVLS